MWWKKVLYFLLVIVLGFGITVIAGSINFSVQAKNLNKKFAEEKDYAMVERFFCYTTPKETLYKYRFDNQDQSHVDIYPCLVKQPYYVYYVDEGYVVKYDIVEEAIAFSLFNLPNSFIKEDKFENKGKIALILENNEIINIDFDNRDKEDGQMNYYINFYSYIDAYYSLTAYITYDDYISKAQDQKIKQVEIYDGNGSKFYSYTLEYPMNFEGYMHETYKEACKNYREFMLEYGQSIALGSFQEKARLLGVIDEITNTNDAFFPKPSTNIIFASDSFILTISITLAAYISIAIVATKLIFFNKKRRA